MALRSIVRSKQSNGQGEQRAKLHTASIAIIAIVIFLLASMNGAGALPAFARKYNLPCGRCHTFPPRLTRFGYEFYRAGYRLPSNQVKPLTLGNSVSLLSTITIQKQGSPNGGDIAFEGVETHLVTSVGKYLSTHVNYISSSLANTNSHLDVTWLQFNSAARGPYWAVRVGQIPVLSGYQLLGNLGISATDPVLNGSLGPLSGGILGNFAINGLERGIEVGYVNAGLYTRLSWFNGVDDTGNGAVSLPGNRFNDLALQSEYLIDKDGSSVGGYYYHGRTPLLTANFTNDFYRAGLVGTWARNLVKGDTPFPDYRLELNGGLLYGEDQIDNSGTRANTIGTVFEADLYSRYRTAYLLRYDTARPSTVIGTPTTEAFSVGLVHRPNNFMTLQLEYRNQRQPNVVTFTGAIRLLY